jgi:hypothetical protein
LGPLYTCLACVSELGGASVVDGESRHWREATSRVLGGHGNYFAKWCHFLFLHATFRLCSASMTKWSMRSHRVYKHLANDCFFTQASPSARRICIIIDTYYLY